jgi:hypothetical protein
VPDGTLLDPRLPRSSRLDEHRDDAVVRSEQNEVRTAAEELEHERASLAKGPAARFEDRDPVRAHGREIGDRPALEVRRGAAEERPERTRVPLDARVLQVDPRRVGIGGESQAQDALVSGLRENQDEIARREREDLADLRAPDEGRDLAAELGDVRRGEVQTFSPSRS